MRLVDKDSRHDDWLTRGADDERLSAAERAASWDEWYELRREADIDFVEMMR